jgi:hypothetical protein
VLARYKTLRPSLDTSTLWRLRMPSSVRTALGDTLNSLARLRRYARTPGFRNSLTRICTFVRDEMTPVRVSICEP